jgi:hypothetical protein
MVWWLDTDATPPRPPNPVQEEKQRYGTALVGLLFFLGGVVLVLTAGPSPSRRPEELYRL